jgi:hypothetical protein
MHVIDFTTHLSENAVLSVAVKINPRLRKSGKPTLIVLTRDTSENA